MRLEQNDSKRKPVRFDRILILKGSDKGDPAVRPRTVDLLGTEAIRQVGSSDEILDGGNHNVKRRGDESDSPCNPRLRQGSVFPSDHFGLIATLD